MTQLFAGSCRFVAASMKMVRIFTSPAIFRRRFYATAFTSAIR
jgi:hypothetical protein